MRVDEFFFLVEKSRLYFFSTCDKVKTKQGGNRPPLLKISFNENILNI
jgi:hypothetical protein